MCREQQPHDPEAWFGAQCGEHIRILGDVRSFDTHFRWPMRLSNPDPARSGQTTSVGPLLLHGPAGALVQAGEGRCSDANPASLSAPAALASPSVFETNRLPLRRNRLHLLPRVLLAPRSATVCFASQARCGKPV